MVELTKKRIRKFSAKGYFFILISIIFIVWVLFFSGIIKKDCKQDNECFNKALRECKPAKFINLRENNLYEYKIMGSKGNLCEMEIELRNMGVGTPISLIEKFEGKSMRCLIPIKIIDGNDFGEIGNVINYCSGPLKEAIFELIIDRMYGLIIKNIGEIAAEVREDLFSIR